MHELHHLVLLHNLRHVGLVALFCLVGRRQGGEILAEQRTKLRHIDLADEDGFEVARIAETLTIDFEDAVVIRFFCNLHGYRSHTHIVVVQSSREGVVIDNLRTGVAVLQERKVAVHHSLERHAVLARSSEIEMSQLKHRLQVFY